MCIKAIPVRLGYFVAFAGFALASSFCAAAEWKPDKNVEIITGASAGGGNDRLARTIQRIWKEERLVAVTVLPVNKPGGGNALSWNYLNQHPGDGHYIAIANPNLVTNHITGRNAQHYTDFTPIVMLLSESVALAVRADSPIKTGKQVLARLKQEPGSFNVAIGSAVGGANHISIAKVTKAVGGDVKKLKPVVFNSMGEAITALLGGHVDAVAGSASNMVAQMQAQKLRVIAISAPRRLAGVFAEVPTWKEQGVDAITSNWRGFIGPRGMTQASGVLGRCLRAARQD